MIRKATSVIVGLALIFSLCSCGYFLYPERRGQTEGRVDPAIMVVDCVLLVFFLVPGVIALAVDFSSGAIYLPKGSAGLQKIDADKERLHDTAYIEGLIKKHSGLKVELDDSMQVTSFSLTDLNERLGHLNAYATSL